MFRWGLAGIEYQLAYILVFVWVAVCVYEVIEAKTSLINNIFFFFFKRINIICFFF